MNRFVLKSKIHRCTVTDSNLNYEGSINIDEHLMKSANIIEYEQVSIYNVTNGERFETYAIKGEHGDICLNGAAAHKAMIGDIIIIVTYTMVEDNSFIDCPKVVHVNELNEETICSR